MIPTGWFFQRIFNISGSERSVREKVNPHRCHGFLGLHGQTRAIGIRPELDIQQNGNTIDLIGEGDPANQLIPRNSWLNSAWKTCFSYFNYSLNMFKPLRCQAFGSTHTSWTPAVTISDLAQPRVFWSPAPAEVAHAFWPTCFKDLDLWKATDWGWLPGWLGMG